jgi:hypothetical protein
VDAVILFLPTYHPLVGGWNYTELKIHGNYENHVMESIMPFALEWR